MSLHTLRAGLHLMINNTEFRILRRLPEDRWQLENLLTGEWSRLEGRELLDRFARNELRFPAKMVDGTAATGNLEDKLKKDLASIPPDLVRKARIRLEYLKEIDRQQPISITQRTIQPLVLRVAAAIADSHPPGWRTVCRDYRKWRNAQCDIRAIIPRLQDRGKRGMRMVPEVKAICDQVIEELYMTTERKRVPEIHLELLRRLDDANRFRTGGQILKAPSLSTTYRAVAQRSPYDLMVARYGKRRAELTFRTTGNGLPTSRALERVVMDHTPADIIVVDDISMLPLGRPTITTALDEHTRCPTGVYVSFEPPSCLAVMRCMKHAILPKTYISQDYPSVKNSWPCYGVPEVVVVDNPPEFHSGHFERACLQIGVDIQYAKVLIPWYKGKLERFQGTMNHDLMHGTPGTTFSSILERDDYDPSKHAVVLLSTFRELLHKWIVDVYLQTPHRGLRSIPVQKWMEETNDFAPPLPPSAAALDTVLGMTTQRVAFHYGVELEGLKYNSHELGELRRRLGNSPKVELTFDPGDLGYIYVLDSATGDHIRVPALEQSYAHGLSLWQNKVIRRYAQRQLNGRTDLIGLAQAKAEIRALVDRDFHRKSTRGRKRHSRFLTTPPKTPLLHPPVIEARVEERVSSEILKYPHKELFSDEGTLPVFEADLDLPQITSTAVHFREDRSGSEESHA